MNEGNSTGTSLGRISPAWSWIAQRLPRSRDAPALVSNSSPSAGVIRAVKLTMSTGVRKGVSEALLASTGLISYTEEDAVQVNLHVI